MCGWFMAHLTGANIAPEGGEWALDWCGFVCVCVCVVHGNLTGANIAPEGGEWALDWCGFVCVCVWFMATLLAPILRRRAVYVGWIRVGVVWWGGVVWIA